MKIRFDFVTNSSSSSFVLARKGKLTDEQKDAIIKFVEENFLGEAVLSPESTEKEIQKAIEEYYSIEINEKSVREALAKGFNIYSGEVAFEESDYDLAAMYQKLWEILSKKSPDNFDEIDTSLDY
ncbi:MAG: hypothetical protein IJS81_11560 [Selenomonadaceae bacterium]|nr:hypothetical protein [Selenomonadaceae bacterium]